MNNIRRSAKSWPQMLGLCPLLVIDLAFYDTLLLSVVLLIVLLSINTAMALLQRLLTERQRLIATALLAASIVGVVDLLLQAFCYAHAQALQYYLPLLVIAPLLFYRSDTGDPIKLPRVVLEALLGGSAFACAMVIAALIRSMLPSETAIAAGLLCGALLAIIANKIDPPRIANAAPPAPTARIRARVTGPVR